MPDPPIKVVPFTFAEVLDVLHSASLRKVEQGIAQQTGQRIIEDYSPVCINLTLASMSVSGMNAAQIQALLDNESERLIAFGVKFLREEGMTRDEEEHALGEEEEPSTLVEVRGLGTGFGITYAIYYNFAANRTPAEFRAYLKNRRIGGAAKFASQLRRILQEIDANG
jgi:hypothetical protein